RRPPPRGRPPYTVAPPSSTTPWSPVGAADQRLGCPDPDRARGRRGSVCRSLEPRGRGSARRQSANRRGASAGRLLQARTCEPAGLGGGAPIGAHHLTVAPTGSLRSAASPVVVEA